MPPGRPWQRHLVEDPGKPHELCPMKKLLLLALCLYSPHAAVAAPEFSQDEWGDANYRPVVLATLPVSLRPLAQAYLQQVFDVDPTLQESKVLHSYLAARHDWARRGGACTARLAPLLVSPRPWERIDAALLLGGTHEARAIAPLLAARRRESHRDVTFAFDAALAELGNRPQQRARSLVEAERAEQRRMQAGAARGSRDCEIRCSYLIELGCNIHRKDTLATVERMVGDDGGLGESYGSAKLYLRADLGLLSAAESQSLGLPTSLPRVVAHNWRQGDRSYRYPQLAGLPDLRVQQRINDELRAAFLPTGNAAEQRDFLITWQTDRYLSVRYRGWGRQPHGSTSRLFAARTFDLATGRVIQLADLFEPGSPWRAQLKSLASPIIERQIQTAPGPRFLATPPRFYLTGEKLVLFDVFHDGTDLEAALAKNDLQTLARPGGPLTPSNTPHQGAPP